MISFESIFWADDDKRGIVLNAARGTILDTWGDKDKLDKKLEDCGGSIYADKFIGSKRDDARAGMKTKDGIDGAGMDEVRYNRDWLRGGGDGVVDLGKGSGDGYILKIDHRRPKRGPQFSQGPC